MKTLGGRGANDLHHATSPFSNQTSLDTPIPAGAPQPKRAGRAAGRFSEAGLIGKEAHLQPVASLRAGETRPKHGAGV